jgi:hypothetical protein
MDTPLTSDQVYYALHREARLLKKKESYAARPEVIAARLAREQKHAAKMAQKELACKERELARKEKMERARLTRGQKNDFSPGPPVENNDGRPPLDTPSRDLLPLLLRP